jgi:hypothetical protein
MKYFNPFEGNGKGFKFGKQSQKPIFAAHHPQEVL